MVLQRILYTRPVIQLVELAYVSNRIFPKYNVDFYKLIVVIIYRWNLGVLKQPHKWSKIATAVGQMSLQLFDALQDI